MAVTYVVLYHEKVVSEDLPPLDTKIKQRIREAIEEKLTTAPVAFGKPLRRSLAGYRKLRVGDYRVVFKISREKVLILTIQHRSVVYEAVLKRM